MADIYTVPTAYRPVTRSYRAYTSNSHQAQPAAEFISGRPAQQEAKSISGQQTQQTAESSLGHQPISAAGRAVLRNRRIRRARMKRRILMIMILLALAAMFIFGRISAHAINTADESSLSDVSYVVITVEDGDTLWDIASEWSVHTDDDVRTYLDNLRDMNKISGDLIKEGQQLLVYCQD